MATDNFYITHQKDGYGEALSSQHYLPTEVWLAASGQYKDFYYDLNTCPPQSHYVKVLILNETVLGEKASRTLLGWWIPPERDILYKTSPETSLSTMPSGTLPGDATCAPESRPSPLNLMVS